MDNLGNIFYILEEKSGENRLELVLSMQSHAESDLEKALNSHEIAGGIKIRETAKKDIRAYRTNIRQRLSEAFQRIILYETAGYLAQNYESFLDDARLVPAVMRLFFPDKIKITEPLSPPGEIIPELRRAQKLALQENDLSEAYLIMRTIAQSLPLDYIVQLNQLKSAFPNCAPKPYSDLLTLNIGDRVGTFLINDEGRYEKKLKGDERFRKFLITYLGFDDVLKPSAGYIRLASPEPLDYVAGFLDRFFAFQTLVSPSEITIRSEDPWKYFRGNLSRVCNTKREKLA